jgi:glycosyltransferase involved in cell wall biosynthesis
LIVATQILGWKNYSRYVLSALEQSGLDFGYCQTVTFDYDTYEYFQVPRVFRISDALTAASLMRAKVEREVNGLEGVDYFLIIGHQLSLFLYRYLRTKRFTIVLDATPVTSLKGQRRVEKNNARSLLKSFSSKVIDYFLFRRVLSKAHSFIAMSSYVKESLIVDYGVEADSIFVAYPPQEIKQVEMECVRAKRPRDKINLIFVGNDFARKGGDFLEKVFSDELSRIANLKVVSNDPSSKALAMLDGVEVLEGLDQSAVFHEMRLSDVLLFPSWKDEFGLVIAEAMSQGLAIFARECGAQGELVKSGTNGKLFGYYDPPEYWREAIKTLHRERDTTLPCYKEQSLRMANEKFNYSAFNSKVRNACVKAMSNM